MGQEPPPPPPHPVPQNREAEQVPTAETLPRLPEAKRRRLVAEWSGPSLGPASPILCPYSPHGGLEPGDWWSSIALTEGSAFHRAVEELRRYVVEFQEASSDPFWHRKSGKVSLSIVLCRGKDGEFKVSRGMNTEVSLPAGSLCAERAAIGHAASSFQRASEILVVATVDPGDNSNPLWPCEVCQSWLVKLRTQNPEISVLAMGSPTCETFAVRVNGEIQPPPMHPLPMCSPSSPWQEQILLADGTMEFPWEARDLVYVDGAWTFLHGAHQTILKEARQRGTHLLVGVHSDEVLEEETGGPVSESFDVRVGRLLQNRHVSSVLRGAPWSLTHDLISSLGIKRVVTGSVCKGEDVGKESRETDPYGAAREAGILEVVPSSDETTEKSIRDSHVSRARL